ncbi:MAG: hypothetical protein ACI9RO_002296, partial [Alteromonas macleodii]
KSCNGNILSKKAIRDSTLYFAKPEPTDYSMIPN